MNLKEGKLHKVKFLDHCLGPTTSSIVCEVCGWFIEETKYDYKFTWWLVENDEYRDDNMELFHIVKSTVLEIRAIS